jgi:RNA polymerase primary sigma factor/RNA polymerase sigma factor
MLHRDYRNPVLRQLRDEQVTVTPRDLKLAHAYRAEKLISELEPGKTYSYDFLRARITDDRPKNHAKFKVSGDTARHDLRLFVEDVYDAADVDSTAAGEPVWTVEDLSQKFKVSTKTIARWRDLGLVSRRFLFKGRKRVGFLQSSVEQFVNRNRERVRRGAAFSQLTAEERNEVIHRAREMAKAGGCPSEVARRLADQLGRSVETIRYTIKHHDSKHPQEAVFPGIGGSLTEEAKKKIFHLYRRGTSVEALAKQYCRSKPAIYRIINEMRGRRVLQLPLDLIDNAEFSKADAAEKILAPMPNAELATKKSRPPSGLPPYLASLYEVPLLTREQEQHLFRKFNFLKYQAVKLRDQLLDKKGEFDAALAKGALLDEIESLYDQIVHVKNEIIRHNLRLVVSIAKRHVGMGDNFFELVSDGNMSLIRAVEKFDYSRGNKFSTYASWAIMKNFARTIPLETRQRDRFRTSQAETFASREDLRGDEWAELSAQSQREAQIQRIMRRLDDREQQIIKSRFGLGVSPQGQTLKEVGDEMGVTKERVRQIEARALKKLYEAALEEKISPDDLN